MEISQIFNALSLRDALHASYVSRSWNAALSEYVYRTYNPHEYLSSFTYPKHLLETFRCTGAVISGSRCLSYFLPSLRRFTLASDWDVYVPHPHQHILHEELIFQGCRLTNGDKVPIPGQFKVYNYVNAANEKVQLVALVPERRLFDCLINFHTSVVQNYISGWGCCSIYWERTFEGRGWTVARLQEYPEYQKTLAEKYSGMGMRIVPWEERERTLSEVNAFTVLWSAKEGCMGQTYLSLKEVEMALSPQCTSSIVSK